MNAEEILGYGVLAVTGFLAYILLFYGPKYRTMPARDAKAGVVARVLFLISRTAHGVHRIGRSLSFYESFGVSPFVLLGQALSFWIVMRAYGLGLSFWHGAAVFLIVLVGTIIPSAPSNIGTYQFFTVVGLTLFGIEKTVATGFSVVVFLILTIPLWIIGMLVFVRLGLNLKSIRTEIAALGKKPAT